MPTTSFYVEGTSLMQLLAGGTPLARGVALRIAIDVCGALEAIHSATDESGAPLGLLHQDMSPSTILVGVDGVARVTDVSATRHGETVGYASPEYLLSGVKTASCDMFAFGVIVWEMLAGRRLFAGQAGLAATSHTVPRSAPRLSSVVTGVPAMLDVVVAKAAAPAIIDRFATMQSLRVALEGAAHGRIASREEVAAVVFAVSGASAPAAPRTRPRAPRLQKLQKLQKRASALPPMAR